MPGHQKNLEEKVWFLYEEFSASIFWSWSFFYFAVGGFYNRNQPFQFFNNNINVGFWFFDGDVYIGKFFINILLTSLVVKPFVVTCHFSLGKLPSVIIILPLLVLSNNRYHTYAFLCVLFHVCNILMSLSLFCLKLWN